MLLTTRAPAHSLAALGSWSFVSGGSASCALLGSLEAPLFFFPSNTQTEPVARDGKGPPYGTTPYACVPGSVDQTAPAKGRPTSVALREADP